MNSTSPTLTDLVLSLEDAQDQPLTVTTDKCLLGIAGSFQAGPARCVIYRGRRGTALYTLTDQVKVNGGEAAVHWLQPGDSIELLDRLRLMVQRLQAEPVARPVPPLPAPPVASSPAAPSETEYAPPAPIQPLAPAAWAAPEVAPPATEDAAATPEPASAPYSYADDTGEESILALGLGKTPEEEAPAAQSTVPATEDPLPRQADAADGAAEPPETHSQGAGAPSIAKSSQQDSILSPLAASLVAELTAEDSVTDEAPVGTPEALKESATAEPTRKKSPTEGLAAELIRDLTREREQEASQAVEESTEAEANEAAEQAKPTAESVADVLARMQESGQLDDVPVLQVESEPEDELETEPPQAVEPPPAPTPLPSFDSEEVDVSGYMNQLLSRMSGGAPEVESPAAAAPEPEAEEVDMTEYVQVAEPDNPLSPEEFKPKQKAEPVKSLDAMRELANETARSAIKQSNDVRRQALGKLQIGIGVASFGLALYYLTVGSKSFFDVPFLAGVTCLGVSGFLAYRFYGTILHNERVEEAAIRRAKLKQAAEEAGEELPEEALSGDDAEALLAAQLAEPAEAPEANQEA